MKKANLLYSLAILALIVLIASVINDTIERHPMEKKTQQTSIEPIPTKVPPTKTQITTAVKQKPVDVVPNASHAYENRFAKHANAD